MGAAVLLLVKLRDKKEDEKQITIKRTKKMYELCKTNNQLYKGSTSGDSLTTLIAVLTGTYGRILFFASISRADK
jgi:hypothetical protein